MEHPAREGRGGIADIRRDFPLLGEQPGSQRAGGRGPARDRGTPLVYLDNAATTQKPRVVIDRLSRFYLEENANVQRGVYALSERATAAYERARATLQRFVNAASPGGIVFVRGTTEAINLVAAAWGRAHLNAGDEVVVSEMEHHSNIVPWQIVCAEKRASLRVIPIDDAGDLRLDEYERLLNEHTRLVSIVHVSNALGTVNPVREIVRIAHDRGIPVLVDGAQAVAHMRVDVQELGCDFYAFSGHKVYGPTGVGVLYGRPGILDALPPYQGGGGMIRSVTFDRTIYADAPQRFEAGTPDIGGVVALGCAVEYLEAVGFDEVASHEHELLAYATAMLSSVPGLRIIGEPGRRAAILPFVVEGVHPHDVGTLLDHEGVAVRAGHHCCQPLMKRLGLAATVRASLALYNTRDDIDALAAAVARAREMFA